jgi:fucose permease
MKLLRSSLLSARHSRALRTAGYCTAFAALGLVGAALGPTLPGLAEQTGTGLSDISFLFTANALGFLLGSSQVGRVYDRLPGHPVMAAGLLIMAGMLALTPVTPLLWLLTLILGVLGMAQGMLDVGGNTLLVWDHREHVGPFMNALHFFFGVGSFLSPILINRAAELSGGIAWAFWALALLMLPPAVWLMGTPSPSQSGVTEDRPEGPVDALLVLLVAIFLGLYVGAEVSFGGWIYSYAVTLNIAGEAMAAYLTSAFWGALTAGRLLAIPLASHLRPRAMLVLDLAGCLLGIGIILSWPGSLVATWVGTLAVGLAMASVFPTTLSMTGRLTTLSGRVTSWLFVGVSAGAMSIPWAIGQLFEAAGPRATMWTILAATAAAVGVLFAIWGAARSRR